MNTSIYGLGGDALTSPEHTETAFWAALGGGASGIVSGLRLSSDKEVVCTNYDSLSEISGSNEKIADLDWSQIRREDAGAIFSSTVLDGDDQPNGSYGLDKPWAEVLPRKRAIRLLRLDQLLITFPRRTKVFLSLPENEQELMDITISELKKYGVLNRVTLLANLDDCNYLKSTYPNCVIALSGSGVNEIQNAKEIGASGFYLDWDIACSSNPGGIELDPNLQMQLESTDIELLVGSNSMPYAPKQDYIDAILDWKGKVGVISRGVLPTVEKVTPSARIFQDSFEGTRINRAMWSAGYSHINQDTLISQNDGLHIEIKENGSYSGAAGICLIPIHNRFDAQVEFEVSNPKQGTTFEMAAICIDPGYHHMENDDLNTRNVNLTFDVHGAPPYASAERDENDGFRCGWNNGFNLTRVESNWQASSVNMYNKYGRDVGNGSRENGTGSLRLVRNGSVFVSYYMDNFNKAWVCSGTMLVQNMANDIYIRLAAKHWSKGQQPPANKVSFYNFNLFQF